MLRIAPGAAEVAAREADEHRGHPREETLALQRVEDFSDLHGSHPLPAAAAATKSLGLPVLVASRFAVRLSMLSAMKRAEQEGVVDAAGFEGIGQRADHVLLADQFGETPGAPLAGKHKVGHAAIVAWATRSPAPVRAFCCGTAGPPLECAIPERCPSG